MDHREYPDSPSREDIFLGNQGGGKDRPEQAQSVEVTKPELPPTPPEKDKN